jgi:exosortase/archaeosortase family protein
VTLLAIALQYHQAFVWLVRTWNDATYESWGFLPLLLLAPRLLRPPSRRPVASLPHLAGLAALALLDLIAAPLHLHVVSALLGLVSLHLWVVAFRAIEGRWYLRRELWLIVLSLPVVFWANVICGYPVQHLATGLAARGLALYGMPAVARGTVIQLPGAVVAVDASCSGLKLAYSGVLFGLVATPARQGWGARLLFWAALLALLLGANVVRVMSLTMAQLHLGHPLGGAAHEAVGLVAFALACAASLLVLRGAARARLAPTEAHA